MPFDEHGNRADIVMDPNSTINRMNIGRCYEQYYNSASRDLCKIIRTELGIGKFDMAYYSKIMKIVDTAPEVFDRSFRYLLGYYKIISPEMFKTFSELDIAGQIEHIASIMQYVSVTGKDALYIYQPTDNEVELIDTVKEIEKYYKPLYGSVSYVGTSGKQVITKNKVRIGSMYFMLLEKIGDTWSALSSGKLQHFGVLSKLNKADRNHQPTRTNPVRGAGEAETRILSAYVGKKATAEIFDRNNNPGTHKEIVMRILTAPNPALIDNIVDRTQIPFGGAKPLQLVSHIASCQGWKFVYSKEKKQ